AMSFVVDDLSNWYVRLSRDRFYEVDTSDNRAAFATLHTTLATVCRLLAPIAPFITDWMHRELTGVSVHLASYVRPEGDHSVLSDPELEAAMEEIRELATLGRAAREVAGVRVRQPLSRMVCVVSASTPLAAVQKLVPLLAAELNVQSVEFANDAEDLVTLEARADFRTLGKRFGTQTPLAAAAIAALSSDRLSELERGGTVTINVEGTEHALSPENLQVVRRSRGSLVVQEAYGRFAALDAEVTPELRREGIARELVSRTQRLRKESGLEVSDRIRLWISGDAEVSEAVDAHRDWIAQETLARELHANGATMEQNYARAEVDLDGITARLALTRE